MRDTMEPSKVRSCLVCAWRENCQKKFSGGPELAQHCIDYTRDVSLKIEAPKPSEAQPPK